MLNDPTQLQRCGAAAVLLLLLAVLIETPASGEIGWSQVDYVKHVGPATVSPMTPEQVRFTSGGDSVLVRFADGHSREELWAVGEQTDHIPAALLRQAQEAVRGTPLRRVDFQVPHAPAAEIFEMRATDLTLQVDRRGGRIVRIAVCRSAEPCVLLDQLLAMERATDALIGRTEQQLHRQGK